MESKHQIKLDISKFVDSNIICMPTDRRSAEMAQRYETELLKFAARFKTRRVYVVRWNEYGMCRIDFYYKCFKYEDRAIAYDIARRHHVYVNIHDFKNLIDKPLEYISSIPSPNRREAIELWKTFNTCCACCCETEQCEDVLYMGKRDRMCMNCINKIYATFVRVDGRTVFIYTLRNISFKINGHA